MPTNSNLFMKTRRLTCLDCLVISLSCFLEIHVLMMNSFFIHNRTVPFLTIPGMGRFGYIPMAGACQPCLSYPIVYSGKDSILIKNLFHWPNLLFTFQLCRYYRTISKARAWARLAHSTPENSIHLLVTPFQHHIVT